MARCLLFLWLSTCLALQMPIAHRRKVGGGHRYQAANVIDERPALFRQLGVAWRFTRPHTLIGTIVSVPAVHALAAPSLASCMNPNFLFCVLAALIPAMFVNVFITGLNQVYDADIDKINKPNLPIASGELSLRDAKILSWSALGLATVSAVLMMPTPPLLAVLYGSALLGAAYSAPPFRLKRWPVPAALCIVSVRGALVNTCFFLHACLRGFSDVTMARTPAQAHLAAVTLFFAIFGVAIALLKDVPDTEGDSEYDVTTASTALGRNFVFTFATTLLLSTVTATSAAFLFTSALAFSSSSFLTASTRLISGLALAALALDLRSKAVNVDPAADKPVARFYMRLWNLFYASYFILPFVR